LSPATPLIAWTDAYPPRSPPHADLPYAFKAYAFEHAFQERDTVLWLDANVLLHPSPDPSGTGTSS
jgi:hypothetical protein